MAKSRKKRQNKTDGTLIALLGLIFLLITLAVKIMMKFLVFVYYWIAVYKTGYKEKSGNGFFKTYFNKGNFGEFLLYKKLIKVLDKQNVFTNIYLPGKNTEKTEVDIIALTKHAIYVFEVKNYSGYIYGTQTDKEWTQVLNKFVKNKFYNPLRQNYAHTKAVEAYLEIDEKSIISVINFSDRSKLQKINVDSTNKVFKTHQTLSLIKENKKNDIEIFNRDQIKIFAEKIILASKASEDIKKKHIDEVNTINKK